jgi:hypothetical protein
VTVSNPDLLSSSEAGISYGIIKSLKITFLYELDTRKPLVRSISQIRGELRLHNLVCTLTVSNPGLKTVSSNNSPG